MNLQGDNTIEIKAYKIFYFFLSNEKLAKVINWWKITVTENITIPYSTFTKRWFIMAPHTLPPRNSAPQNNSLPH